MKVGIMGGTFDPIHYGHLVAAEQARVGAKLDEVWFMPTHVPPHKSHLPAASAARRWEMVNKAIEDHPCFRACDLELRQGGTSYTVNTVKLLCSQEPGIDFAYIIGADMVEFLPNWFKINEIIQYIYFIGLQRPGYSIDMTNLTEAIEERVTIVACR